MGGGELSVVMDGHKPTLKWSAMTLDISILVRFLMETLQFGPQSSTRNASVTTHALCIECYTVLVAVSDVWLDSD